MFVDVNAKINCSIDIESGEAFKILCKTLHMDFVLDEDTSFFIKRNSDDENCVYTLKGGHEEECDDRGDLFIALRNVAVNMFPNVNFRSADYIFNR